MIRRELAIALAVAAGSYLWLNSINGPAWAGHDQATGLAMAQDCIKLSVCHLSSVDSGVRGFTNGAMWLHFLTLIGLLHGTTVAARAVTILLISLGIAAVYICTRRWLREEWALPAALFTLFGVGGAGELFLGRDIVGPLAASNFIDATATFFPAAMEACFLLVFVISRRMPALIGAAIFASHAMCTHVAAASLMPALIASAALAGRRPILAAACAAATAFVTALISSPYAVAASREHLQAVEEFEIVTGVVVLAVAGAFVQARFLRLSSIGRAGVLAALLVLPLTVGALWMYFDNRPPTSRYLAPIAAPLGVILAALFSSLADKSAVTRRWLPIAIAGGFVFIARNPVDRSEWEFEDGRVVAKALEAHGYCYAGTFARLQGAHCRSLAYATVPYACRAPSKSGEPSQREWRFIHTESAAVPELPHDAEILPSSSGRAVILSQIDSWLDKPAAESCIEQTSGRKCVRAEMPDGDPFLYSHRLSLGFKDTSYSMPFKMSFAIPMLPVAGQTHLFSFGEEAFPLPNESNAKPCGWQVTRADGVETDRPLPANPVRLTSRDGKAGTLVIERLVGGSECLDGFPGLEIPCHWETSADDPAWMSQVRQ